MVLILFIFIKKLDKQEMEGGEVLRQEANTGPRLSLAQSGDYGTGINVYNVKGDNQKTGWIVLSFSLTVVIMILLVLILVGILQNSEDIPCSCYGSYGMQVGVDAPGINQCGTSRNEPCIFRKNSIADCVTECETLSSVCQAFTFNESNLTMKIVRPVNVYESTFTNLFVRQSGTTS